MINIDEYLQLSVEVRFGGRTLHLKPLSIIQMQELSQIEKGFEKKEKNGEVDIKSFYETKEKRALLFLNNNREEITLTLEEIKEIPSKMIDQITEEVIGLKIRINNDPNSKSPSQVGTSEKKLLKDI